MRKLLCGVMILALTLAAFAGCGQGDSSTSPAQSSPAADASSSPGSAEGVTISIFSMFAVPDEDANSRAFTAQMEKFQKDFPGVTVEQEAVKHDEYETKMKTYVAGGSLPDIFQVKGTMIPQLADDGDIIESQVLLDLVPGWQGEYKGGVFDDFMYAGKAWAMPFQMGNNHNIYWNSDIFAECGINEFPKTWDDFLNAIETLKSNGYVPISMGNKGQWLCPSLIFNTIVYRYVPVDWYDSLKNNTGAKFTDSEFVAATACMQDLAAMGAFNTDMNSIDQQQMRTLYYNKQAAMMIDGFWGVAVVETEAPEDVLAATRLDQFPAIPDGNGIGNINQAAAGWGWVVTTGSEDAKLQAAAGLVHYITGPDYANVVVANGGMPATDPSFVDESKLTPLYRELLRVNGESVYAPVFDVQLNPQVVDAFYSNLQDVLIGTMTPERYSELLQKEMDDSR